MIINKFDIFTLYLLKGYPMKNKLVLLVLPFFAINIAIADINEKDVPKIKRTQAGLYLSAKDAYQALKEQAEKIVFLDVRTKAEVAYTGMPTAADANVPFKFTSKKYEWSDKKNGFKMTPNPNFVVGATERVLQKSLGKDDKIFVMCRSGGRSAKAADALTKAGFTKVYSIIDGYEGDTVKSGEQKGKRTINGWKNSSLPWSFSLNKSKMYLSSKADKKESKGEKMLKKMDDNKDGHLSKGEFDTFHKKMFAGADKNADGLLSTEELKKFKKAKKENKVQ